MSKLDFDALRKKLDELQGQNRRSNALWKPPAGKSVIRIIPWKERLENPFIELLFHYIGNRTQLSPLTFGRNDPIAEFADKLRASGDRDEWQFAKQFTPKLRTFAPVIVRGEEEQGVRFWGFGKTVYEELLGVIDDPEWGDITDPQDGRDIGIEHIPQKDSDTAFAKTLIRVKPNITPVTSDASLLESFLEEQPDIYKVFTEPTYEELEQFLERFLGKGDSSVTTEEKSPSMDDDISTPTANVENEFEKLFDEK